MATSNRRQTSAEPHIGSLRSRPDEVMAARRRTTDGRDHARDHDHETRENTDAFNSGRRSTYTHTRTPVPRYVRPTTRQQRTSTREEYHDDPLQERIHAYKTQLVDDLNAQMSRADNEITRRMDELSEELDGQLELIDEAGGKFLAGLGEERVQIGTSEGEDENSRQQVSLEEVMADLKTLMEAKKARLTVLTEEYTRLHHESVKLAIAILGEEKVSLVESNLPTPKPIPTAREPQKETPNTFIDTIAAKQANQSFEQVYDDAEAGFIDLQSTLDEMVARNLEENKGALKAFQTGRKVKQSELSKLLSSWSLC